MFLSGEIISSDEVAFLNFSLDNNLPSIRLKTLIILVVFLTTLIPLMPFFKAIGPLYIPFIGAYGLTYAVNYSIASSLFGSLIVLMSPLASRQISKFRDGKIVPFQGVMITLLSLLIIGGIIQLLL